MCVGANTSLRWSGRARRVHDQPGIRVGDVGGRRRSGALPVLDQIGERRALDVDGAIDTNEQLGQLDSGLLGGFSHQRRIAAVDDRMDAIRIIEVVPEQGTLRGVVDRNADGPELAEREHEPQVLGTVLHHDRHMLAGLDAGVAQTGGELVRHALDVGVAVDVVAKGQVWPLAVSDGGVRENVAHGALFERVDVHLGSFLD